MKKPTRMNGLAISELHYCASKSSSNLEQPTSKIKKCNCALPSKPARQARNMAEIARTLKAGGADIVFEGLSRQFCDHCRTIFHSEFEKKMEGNDGDNR